MLIFPADYTAQWGGCYDPIKEPFVSTKGEEFLKSLINSFVLNRLSAVLNFLSFCMLNKGQTLYKNISLRCYQNIFLQLFYTFICILENIIHTRLFKYDREDLYVNKSQFVPVIFEPPCIKVVLHWSIHSIINNLPVHQLT